MPRRKTNPKQAAARSQEPDESKTRLLLLLVAGVLVLAGLAAVVFNGGDPDLSVQTPADEPGEEPEEGALASVDGDEPLPVISTGPDSLQRELDPRADGWSSEVDAEKAKKNLSKLLSLATAGKRVEPAKLTGVADAFECGVLRPTGLVEVFADPSIRVWEQPSSDAVAGETEKEVTYEGKPGLAQALDAFAEPIRGRDDIHTKVKVIRVASTDDAVTTVAIIETGGASGDQSVGQHANWTCQWRRLGDALVLRSIESDGYREVAASGPEGTWFADCTKAVLGANASFGDQIVYGMDHWLRRIERVQGINVFSRCGVAVGDVNGDGLDDVYVCQTGGLPNRLYVQQADGTAIDRSADAGVDWLDHTSSALLIDLDNDGDQDLVVATMRGVLLMANDASGRFKLKATLPLADTDVQSISAADYDNDGDLDLYVCMDFATHAVLRDETPVGFVYHNANDGAANSLFRNDLSSQSGRWVFTNATVETGLDVNNRRHSLAASWEDYDNDGDQDLYVANDYGQNCLYRNDGGKFVDIATQAGVTDQASGMSVSWGDFNRDGWMDLYIANMFSSAGNRITTQAGFRPGDNQQTRAAYGRFAKGNSLFTGDASGGFKDVGADAGVEMGRWAWSSLFVDLNNDGWQDLLVANGYITTEDTGDL